MLSRFIHRQGVITLRRGCQRFFATGDVQTISVPQMGDSITEGNLVEYMKNVGDPVNVDDVLVIIETDKVNVDVRSEVSGTVVKYHSEEGEDVVVGAALVDIELGEGAPVVETKKDTQVETPSSTVSSTDTTTTTTTTAPPPASQKKYANRFEAMRHNHHRKPLIKFTHGKRDPEPAEVTPGAEEQITVFHTDLGLGAAMYGRPLLSEAEVDAINTGGIDL